MEVCPRFPAIEHVRRADSLPRHGGFGRERQGLGAGGECLQPRGGHGEVQPTCQGVKVSTLLYFPPQARREVMASKVTAGEAPEHPEVAADIIAAQQGHHLSDSKLAKAAGMSPRHLREVKKGRNVSLRIVKRLM